MNKSFLNFFSKKEIIKIDSLVNFNDHFLYIHIPKTGGTSIISILNFNLPSHIKAKEIYNSNCKALLKSRFSFSIVRDPISRFISLYNYAKLEISNYHNNIEPEKALYGAHLDYKLLKHATLNECVNYLINGKLRHDESWNHWEPQYTWLYDEKGELLIQNVYRLESIDILERELSKKLKEPIILPKLNQSTNTQQSIKQIQELSKDSLLMLYEYYKKDFELFGYRL